MTKRICLLAFGMGLVSTVAMGAPSQTTTGPVVLVEHDDLSIAPAGDRVADVEARDPGNLPEEAHGAVVVHDAHGKVLATYDPCATCKYSDTAWSVRGDLAFVATEEKTHRTTVYTVRGGRLGVALLVDGFANTARFSPDGARIAVLATVGAHKRTGATEASAPLTGQIGEVNDEQRIVIVPLNQNGGAGGVSRFASPRDTYVYEFDWMPDGRGFVATAAKGNGDNNWWVATLDYVDAQTGAARVIAAPKMQMNLPRVSPDGRTVAFIGGLMSDWGPIGGDVYTVPVAGGSPTDITPNFRVTFHGIVWRAGALLATALADDQETIVALHPEAPRPDVLWLSKATMRAQRFDGPVAFSADGKTFASLMETFARPQEIVLGRLPARTPADIAEITRDNEALPSNVSAQSVHWTNEGFHAQGWLIGPTQIAPDTKIPMIVIVHGGPSSSVTPHYIVAGGQHGTGFDFVYDMIQRGYYIFWPNDRGSYGQGEAFTRANIRDFGGGDFRDAMAGIDAVEKIAPVDDARLGLYGHSYGGWFAMWANTQTHRFKAIVAGAGVANFSSYYGENGIDEWMIPFFGASYYDDPAPYRAASPIEFIKHAKTPTLIYVGERDVECPAPQSLEYWHGLRAVGTPAMLMIYAGEGHHFRKQADLIDLRARIIGWFDKYLAAPVTTR